MSAFEIILNLVGYLNVVQSMNIENVLSPLIKSHIIEHLQYFQNIIKKGVFSIGYSVLKYYTKNLVFLCTALI
jgi:hypothetical protein